MFDQGSSPHFAAPAPVGHLRRSVLHLTLHFVKGDFVVAVFDFVVIAPLVSLSGERFCQAFYPSGQRCPRRPVIDRVGPLPLAGVAGSVCDAVVPFRGFIYDVKAFAG